MAIARNEVHMADGVTFGTAAASPHAPNRAPLTVAAQLALVAALLSPLWLTALYAWQRSADRAHGSLRRWQDATSPAQRRLLLPIKALVWAAAQHMDSRLPPQLSQKRGHALVPSEEEDAEATAAQGAGGTVGAEAALGRELRPARESEPWHAEMLTASHVRATEVGASQLPGHSADREQHKHIASLHDCAKSLACAAPGRGGGSSGTGCLRGVCVAEATACLPSSGLPPVALASGAEAQRRTLQEPQVYCLHFLIYCTTASAKPTNLAAAPGAAPTFEIIY